LAHDRDRQIGWRPAEHVGQDRYAFAAVNPLHRFKDVFAALLDVVVGPDRDCLDLTLRPYHMFQR
jgi:hypothetical protein